MTLLSILMPTYNGARFLDPQIASILAQTERDFELLVIDDGSSDETVAIIDEAALRDNRIRRLPSTGNEGQRHRLAELVGNAKGRFIAIADQDDLWHPERNARLFAVIGKACVAYGRSQLINGEGQDLGRSILEAIGVDPIGAGPLSTLFYPLLSAHAAIIRLSWLNRAVFFSPPPFDWVIGIEAMLSDGLVYDDGAIVYHRIHGGNQMNGGVVKTKKERRLVSRSRFRASTTFVGADRFDLLTILNQLGRSPAVSHSVRTTFKNAGDACRYAWFRYLTFHPVKGRVLRGQLHELLDRYATSPTDLELFTRSVRSVTAGQFSPLNIVRGVTSYAGRLY